jgi:energy-coupling factor transporter ATP-binding protein EcfA2
MAHQYPKGSEWRKWDLHVHTPSSFEHAFPSWDEYLNLLEKVDDVAVIGITDYFTVDGYKEIINQRAHDELRNFALILPNIELRLNIFVPRRSSGEQQRRLNLHVIFSDQVAVEEIESQFLHHLKIQVDGSPGGTGDERLLTRASIEEVGRAVKVFQSWTSGDPDFVAGCKNITVSLNDITKALQKSCFEGKYLIALPTSDWDQISWEGQDYLTRKILLQTAHAVFCGQRSTIDWCLGRGDLSAGQFQREFGCLKPSLHGSDAHTIDRLCKPENGKFCWIKADPTFEGLKQIVYEPELRVIVQENDPSESVTFAKIDSLTVSLPEKLQIKDESGTRNDFCLNGIYNLKFSDNLTCVIGGRGSGKSTLAHIIYSSWIDHDPKKLSSIGSPLLNLDLQPSPLKRVLEYTTCDVPVQTEFFFQNEIEHAAKNIESMSALIGTRLGRLSSIDAGETLDTLRETCDASSILVDELIVAYDRIAVIDAQIMKAQENIATLKKQTEIIKSDEYKAFQEEIGKLTAKIADFKSYKIDYEKLIKQIESLSASIVPLKWTDEQGREILEALHQSLDDHKQRIQKAFSVANANYGVQDYPTQLTKLQQELGEYLKARGLSPENVQELAQANTRIKELEEEIRQARLQKAPYEESYAARTRALDSYKLSYEAYKARFLEVSSLLQARLAGLSISRKETMFNLEIDYTRLKTHLVDFVKDSLEEDAVLRSDAIERLLFEGTDIATCIQDKQAIRQRLTRSTKVEKHRQIILELFNDEVFLEKFHLRMVKHFLGIDNIYVQTKLGGKLLKNTSFGERCGIVIAIVLVAGTNPIVIDQPEDHLDGKFISDVLVPLLRRQKLNRQIILITRDANMVVGGDAELIHILDSTDEKTVILPASIEDVSYREKYIWILDGGTEAFSRREQKYSIGLLRPNPENVS